MGELVQALVTQSPGGGGALVSMVLPIGIMVVVMWLFMIRPERKKQTEHQDFLSSLKRGDDTGRAIFTRPTAGSHASTRWARPQSMM